MTAQGRVFLDLPEVCMIWQKKLLKFIALRPFILRYMLPTHSCSEDRLRKRRCSAFATLLQFVKSTRWYLTSATPISREQPRRASITLLSFFRSSRCDITCRYTLNVSNIKRPQGGGGSTFFLSLRGRCKRKVNSIKVAACALLHEERWPQRQSPLSPPSITSVSLLQKTSTPSRSQENGWESSKPPSRLRLTVISTSIKS